MGVADFPAATFGDARHGQDRGNHDEHARTRQAEDGPGGRRRPLEAGPGGAAARGHGPPTASAGEAVPGGRPGRAGRAQTRPPRQPPASAGAGRAGLGGHPRPLPRLRADPGAGEARTMPRAVPGQGDGPPPHDRGGLLGAKAAAPARDPPTAQPPRLPGRAGADRRVGARVVRGRGPQCTLPV